MLRTALALASKGLHVFPCAPRQKVPVCEHGCLAATCDAEVIRAWWRERPDLNIAIATGERSGVFAVDVDGLDAEIALRRLEATHGKLPGTVEVITARGRHLYFKMPDVPVCNSAGKIVVGIDVRGDGGYVLVPPSVHPSGRAYAWSVDSAKAFAEVPDWLLAKIAERSNGSGQGTPPAEWRALFADGVVEGQRDCTLARLSGYLLRRSVDPVAALALLQAWNVMHCAPPLPEADIERIVASICGRELRRRGDAR